MKNRTCSADGCDAKYVAMGFCLMHYKRWRKHGDPQRGARTNYMSRAQRDLEEADGLRRCYRCGKRKPIDGGFHHRPPGDRRVTNVCKDCCNFLQNKRYAEEEEYRRTCIERSRVSRLTEPEKRRAQNARSLYGLSLEEYRRLLDEHGDACAICGTQSPRGRWNRLHIDHCHQTGRVRGLLCNRCNAGIGYLGDDPALLRRALEYLERD